MSISKLDNIKQELFCNNVVQENGNISKAYTTTYPDCQEPNIRPASSHLYAQEHIKSRIYELLNDSGLSIDVLNNKLQQLTEHDKGGIQLEAVKTGYKLHGLLGSNNGSGVTNVDSRSININLNTPQLDRAVQAVEELKELNSKLLKDNGLDDK